MRPPNTRIYIATGKVDMRKAANGLSLLVHEVLDKDPLSGHLFVFTNKRANKIKILYWDRNGFCLWYKSLQKAVFRIPKIPGEVFCVNPAELGMILEGIDLAHQRRLETIDYDRVN